MNVTLNVPSTVSIRRGPLVGLVAGVAVLTAVVTWSLTVVAVDSGPAARTSSPSSEAVLAPLGQPARQYVEGVSALSPLELAAAYGPTTVDAVAADLARQQYVDAIRNLTDEQLAAGFGRDDVGTVPQVVFPRLRVR